MRYRMKGQMTTQLSLNPAIELTPSSFVLPSNVSVMDCVPSLAMLEKIPPLEALVSFVPSKALQSCYSVKMTWQGHFCLALIVAYEFRLCLRPASAGRSVSSRYTFPAIWQDLARRYLLCLL